MLYLIEILHQTTTIPPYPVERRMLYLIEILHQTTTMTGRYFFVFSCILSKFYIKPQPVLPHGCSSFSCILSKFYIKPQLRRRYPIEADGCILSKFYIKPQQSSLPAKSEKCCILSKFYIKPQHPRCCFRLFRVVSYRNSTSNHNGFVWLSKATQLYLIEILHQTTTPKASLCPVSRCILSKFYIKPQRGSCCK